MDPDDEIYEEDDLVDFNCDEAARFFTPNIPKEPLEVDTIDKYLGVNIGGKDD